MKRTLLMGLSALLTALLLLSCRNTPQEQTYEAQQNLMGTIVKIKASAKDLPRERFDAVSGRAFTEIKRIEGEMSEWLPDSPISQAARLAGREAVPISDELAALIDLSLAVSRQTGGAFDISFKPLGRLWNVQARKEPPAEAEIQAARRLVDYRNIVLDRQRGALYLKRKGMAVGLGAIAKGYAAGRAALKMEEGGIRNFIIDAGGDLYLSGSKDGQAWTCGVQNPDGGGEPLLRLRVRTDCAVVTSGDYERYFEYGGKRYHHIIDTSTGYPATGARSVTVMAKDPAVADAYATAFFVLGPERAAAIVGRIPGLAFILIDAQGKVWRGGPLAEFIEEIPSPLPDLLPPGKK
jgi:thiamine biosynthesis lipoprotein